MALKFISKYFPPPEFLNPPHIGLSFSDTNIKAIFFDNSLPKSDPQSIVVPLEEGLIVGGVILNPAELVKKLLLVRQNFNLPFVFFTIPDELIYLFSISVPIKHKVDLRESVAFSIEENVPISLVDTVFDFTPTKVIPSPEGYNVSLVVSACLKKEVGKFVEVLSKSGFEVVGAINESQAIASAVIPKNFSDASFVIHARENRIGIYLVREGSVCFSTVRNIREEDYTRAFLDEYEKFLDYCLKYNSSKDQKTQPIFICGEFEYAKKVSEAIVNSIHLTKNKEAKLGNVWTNIFQIEDKTPSISFEDSLNFAGPIGSTLSNIL